MTRQTPKFNEKKARAVILYLLRRGKMTKKKLTYLLFFICFDYFEKFEESLCGFTFLKTKNGIKALELDNLLKQL